MTRLADSEPLSTRSLSCFSGFLLASPGLSGEANATVGSVTAVELFTVMGANISLAGFGMTRFDLMAQKYRKYIHVRPKNALTAY